jgi:histidinol-phosphate aminotransferase
MAAIAFAKKEVVAPDPTFFLLPEYSKKLGATIKNVPLNSNFEHDLQKMRQAISPDTSIVYICNPNNPTGSITPADALREFCSESAKRAIVFADEAYLEYTDDFPRNSMIDLVRKGENIVISRTFSKIYGMAGLRIGYALAKTDLAQKMREIRVTWLNNPTVNAAIAAYMDQNFVSDSKKKNDETRRWFLKEMDTMKIAYAPSAANHVWLNIGLVNKNYREPMRDRGFIVGPAETGWTRLTIGTDAEMRSFLTVFKEVKK